MELVYFYPKRDDAPSRVGKLIFIQLLNKMDKLPFDDVKVIKWDKNTCDYRLKKVKTISFSGLKHLKDYLVHIPISPNIMPNKKSLLHVWSISKNIPLITHYHGDVRKHLLIKFKYERKLDVTSIPSAIFIPLLLKTTTKVVTHSYFLNDIIKSKYDVKRSIVIPNGLEEYWYLPQKGDSDSRYSDIIGKSKFNIFFHGRLSPEKGVDILIKALGKYTKVNPRTMLYIAGNGPQRGYLEKLCSRLNIGGNVTFLGNVNRDTIKFFLENADIAIYPSRFDNFPLAIIEALACANCPVYFSENTGLGEFVRKDGFVLKMFKPTVENIYRVLTGDIDVKVVKFQKEFAKKYRWSKIIKLYLRLYENLVQEIGKR